MDVKMRFEFTVSHDYDGPLIGISLYTKNKDFPSHWGIARVADNKEDLVRIKVILNAVQNLVNECLSNMEVNLLKDRNHDNNSQCSITT